MTQPLPDGAKKLFDGPYLATVATIEPGGRPQVTAIWAKRDGDEVLFSTVKGRRKYENLLRDPRATVFVLDPQDPYHLVEVRGDVEIVDDPKGDLIQELSLKYDGRPFTNDKPGTPRVIVRIKPAKVRFQAGR